MLSKPGWFLRRRRHDAELYQEIRAHIEAEIEERIEAGIVPEQARNDAVRAFGNRTFAMEEIRTMWRFNMLEVFVKDVQYGFRRLRSSPLFATFAITSLALGIGATSGIFSLFDAIVLRKLPVREPDRLVFLSQQMPGMRPNSFLSYPHFVRIRDTATTIDGILAMTPRRLSVESKGQTDLARGLCVSGDYYTTLGLRAAIGRLLAKDDDSASGESVTLTYAYWERRFGLNPSILGERITVNGVPFTVVGIEPREFLGIEVGTTYDVAIPMRAIDRIPQGGRPLWDRPDVTWIRMLARLKREVPAAKARGELDFIYRQVNADAVQLAEPGEREGAARFAREARLALEPGATGVLSGFRETYSQGLRLLLITLSAVLLIASLNVATLLLARSEARRREIAIRLSLGAGRRRLIQQLLTESSLLAALGGAFGLALAWWGGRVLLRIALPNAVSLPVDITLDARVIAFTLAVSAWTCLLFGLLPALRATSGGLHVGAREVGRRSRFVDQALVAAQVGITLVLLVGAGLFLRSLGRLWSQDTGYDRRNVLMFSLDASISGKKSAEASATYRRLLDELRAQAGAVSATASAVRPVDDAAYFVGSFTKPGASPDRKIRVAQNLVAPDYFGTLGIPLLAGRDFDRRDETGGLKSVIVSETLAKRHFPDRSPIGQSILFDGVREIIAVAKDTRYGNVKDAPREVIYRPLFEQAYGGAISYEVRFHGPAASMEHSARALVAKLDPSFSAFRIKTLEMETADSLSRERLLALLTSYFGGFALLLASIGLYGLVSYAVTQRTPEIGLRMALGARPSAIQRMVFSESFRIVLCGVVAGLTASFGVVHLVRTQLYGIEPHDPASVIAATLLLIVITFCASVLPALRAARIDPMRALRCE